MRKQEWRQQSRRVLIEILIELAAGGDASGQADADKLFADLEDHIADAAIKDSLRRRLGIGLASRNG